MTDIMASKKETGQDTVLFSTEIGEGLPLVFIHGWELRGESDQRDFEPVLESMPRLLRIYPDLPGMGSSPADGIQNLDDIYHRLVNFIDARLGIQKFLLVGSSCGAYLARALAQKYGHQVLGLLLRVPLIEPEDESRDLDAFKPLVENNALLSALPTSDKILLGDEILIQTPAYIEHMKDKHENVYTPAFLASDQPSLHPIRSDPTRYRLSNSLAPDNKNVRFFAPTLILCGRQDTSVGYRDSLRLLELYPRSSFAVLDRSSHALPVDPLERSVFAALVGEWIGRVRKYMEEGSREEAP